MSVSCLLPGYSGRGVSGHLDRGVRWGLIMGELAVTEELCICYSRKKSKRERKMESEGERQCKGMRLERSGWKRVEEHPLGLCRLVG